MFFKRELLLITLVILSCSSLMACQPTPTLVPASASGIGVGITSDDCPNVSVQVGQQVSWTNQDSREHLVQDISDEENPQFSSGPLQTGDHFEFTFTQVGTYTYECSEDGSMTGTVTVE